MPDACSMLNTAAQFGVTSMAAVTSARASADNRGVICLRPVSLHHMDERPMQGAWVLHVCRHDLTRERRVLVHAGTKLDEAQLGIDEVGWPDIWKANYLVSSVRI